MCIIKITAARLSLLSAAFHPPLPLTGWLRAKMMADRGEMKGLKGKNKNEEVQKTGMGGKKPIEKDGK